MGILSILSAGTLAGAGNVIAFVVTPTVVVVVVVVVGVGAGIAWLLSKASGSQPIAELRNAKADFMAAKARDDGAAMARHAARVRQIIADHGLTGAEASGALAEVAGY